MNVAIIILSVILFLTPLIIRSMPERRITQPTDIHQLIVEIKAHLKTQQNLTYDQKIIFGDAVIANAIEFYAPEIGKSAQGFGYEQSPWLKSPLDNSKPNKVLEIYICESRKLNCINEMNKKKNLFSDQFEIKLAQRGKRDEFLDVKIGIIDPYQQK